MGLACGTGGDGEEVQVKGSDEQQVLTRVMVGDHLTKQAVYSGFLLYRYTATLPCQNKMIQNKS